MSISKKSKSDIVSASIKKYLASRGIQPQKTQISLSELASLAVVDQETSTRNTVSYSLDKIDHQIAETQYTNFKAWISESADHYKPELAQLLYPLFTHIYIRLLHVTGAPAAAHRFHKRHLSTFQSNSEFKLFIQQLGEINSAEELEQNPSINSFIAARYCVTLTHQTYAYLLRYLETSQCNLILNILNQEVDVTVGDWLGAGSRQDALASLSSPPPAASHAVQDAEQDDLTRLGELTRLVRETSPTAPSVALYRCVSKDEVCLSAETDFKGKLMVSGGEDSQVRLWHVLPSEDPVLLDVSTSSVTLGCDDANGGSPPSLLPRVRTLPQGQGRLLRGHAGSVYDAAFLQDERHVISAGEDTTVRVWDRDTGTNVSVLHGHVHPVWCVASDCLGVNFVTGGMDRTARLWRPDIPHPLRVYAGHEQDVDCVNFHPNCQYIMTGSNDRTVRLWSVTGGRCVRVLTGHKGAVSDVQISPCGRIAASAGEDRKIRIWDLAQGKPIKELKGHTDAVTKLVWGDSRLLCSGSMDGTIRVWDVGLAENENLETYPVGGTILGLNFTETNTLVAVAQNSVQELNGA